MAEQDRHKYDVMGNMSHIEKLLTNIKQTETKHKKKLRIKKLSGYFFSLILN